MKLSEEMRGCLFDMADRGLYWPEDIERSIRTFQALERRGLVSRFEGSILGPQFRITDAGLEAIGIRELAENR